MVVCSNCDGEDPEAVQYRDLLVECDARVYLPEVEALLAG
jgi:hypothetical protein